MAGADHREMATVVRPLGTARDARLRDHWTVLETVAWAATRDLALVSGICRYSPMPEAARLGIGEGARWSAVRMEAEEAFCACGGRSLRLRGSEHKRCKCFDAALSEVIGACGSGRMRNIINDPGREIWNGLNVTSIGLTAPSGEALHPLLPRREIQVLWPGNRRHRNKKKATPDVPVTTLVAFVEHLGNIGQRRAMAAAKTRFGEGVVKERTLREACRIAFPAKGPGRPILQKNATDLAE